MKKKFIVGCIILMIIISRVVIFCGGDLGEMLIHNSSSTIMGEYHNERIVVIVNQRRILDKWDCAEQIVEKCRENSFKNVRFSYDLSKPNELDVIVCRNKKDADEGKWDFRFRYIQETGERQYNIVNDPEKFQIEILHED